MKNQESGESGQQAEKDPDPMGLEQSATVEELLEACMQAFGQWSHSVQAGYLRWHIRERLHQREVT